MSRRNPELRQKFESLHHKFKLDDSVHSNSSIPFDIEISPRKNIRPKSAYVDLGRSRKYNIFSRSQTHGNLKGLENENDTPQPEMNLQRPSTSGASRGFSEIRRGERSVPTTMSLFNPKIRSFMKIRIISEEEGEKMLYVPRSDMMRLLFQKNDLKVYVGPNGYNGSSNSDERLLTKLEYLEIEDLVDVELNDVKGTLLPSAYKRLRKQKINERIIERFERLDAIKQNMERMDYLLQGYEVKSQGNPVDALSLDDISDLVMKDLVTREGVMLQTRQIVENISEENKKLTKEKHNLLQDLTNWFNSHGIDVETLQLHSVENDDPSILKDYSETPFQSTIEESMTRMQTKRDKLESIFSNYKSMKDDTREEEKRKYLSEFERKIQQLESSLVGQVDDLEDAESKIQLLLKKILYLTEELEEERELLEEKSRLSLDYRRKFLQYKGLMLKMIQRLQEPQICEAVDIRYIISGQYTNKFAENLDSEPLTDEELESIDFSLILEDNDMSTANEKSINNTTLAEVNPNLQAPTLDQPAKSIDNTDNVNNTISDTIVAFTDNAMWFTQGEDVETPDEYKYDYVSQPLHELSPLEVKLRVQIDYLNEQLRQMEENHFQEMNFDANTFAKSNGLFEERNKSLAMEIEKLEGEISNLKRIIATREETIDNQSKLLQKVASRSNESIQNEIEEFETQRKRKTTLSNIQVLSAPSTPRINIETENQKQSLTEHQITKMTQKDSQISITKPEATSNDIAPKQEKIDPMTPSNISVPSSEPILDTTPNDSSIVIENRLTEDEKDEIRRRKRNENYILQQQMNKVQSEVNTSEQQSTTARKSAEKSEKKKDSKKEGRKKKSHIKLVPVFNETEERRVKDRNKAILDQTAPDDFNILFDKNSDEYSSTDDLLKALDSVTSVERLRNVAKLLVVDRESILEHIYGTQKRTRKFFEFLSQLFSNKSHQTVYSESEFISDWITFNRKLDAEVSVHSVTKSRKDPGERRALKKMTLREELKYQTTYAIDHEKEERRRRNNPAALSKSILGILVKMYLHLKVFMRRKINSSDRSSSPPRITSTRPQTASHKSKSAVLRRKRKPKVDLAALTRMENHRLQMKERWEEKKKQIIWEQRNRFASYSLVPKRNSQIVEQTPQRTDGDIASLLSPVHDTTSSLFDIPPTLDSDSIESKRKLSSISPRNAMRSPRPKSANPTHKSKRRLSIDLKLHSNLDEHWNPDQSWNSGDADHNT